MKELTDEEIGLGFEPDAVDYEAILAKAPHRQPQDINEAVFGPAWNRLMQAVPFGKATPKALNTPNILGAVEAFNEGQALGWRDETTGLVPGGEALADARTQFEQDNPKTNFALEMAGAVMNPAARLGAKATAARPLIGGATTSGTFGAIMGAGKAEPGNKLMGGLLGGAIAAPLGGLSALGINKLVNSFTNRPAQNIVRNKLQASGLPDDQAVKSALSDIGPDARVIDLNSGTVGLGVGVSLKSSTAADKLRTYLAKRASGSSTRIKAMMRKQFGTKGDDFAGFVDDTIAKRAEQSAPLYEAARNTPINPAVIQQFDDNLTKALGSQKLSGHPEVVGLIRQLRKSLTMPDGSFKTSSEAIQFAREKFGAKIFKAKSSLGNKLYSEMAAIRDQFDSILPPEYAKANKVFSSETKVLEAFDTGKRFFTMEADDIARSMESMSLAERDGLYAGIGKAFTNKIGAKVPTGKIPRALETEKVMEKLSQVLGPDEAKKFMSAIETEGVYSGVRNAIVGGSDTARKLAAQQEITGKMAQEGIPVSTSEAVNLAARGFIGRMLGGGASEKTTNQIADLLVGDLGEEGLKKLMQQPVPYHALAGPVGGVLAGQQSADALE